MNTLESVDFIIVHHTERNNDSPSFVKFRHIYLRGWEDIGYHYLIGNTRPFTINGKIYAGRPENFEGAHTFGYNKNSLGVCIIGNFDNILPSEKQLESLIYLADKKMKEYNLSANNVLGHSEIVSTEKSCPGNFVNMPYIRGVLSGQNIFSMKDYRELIEYNKSRILIPSFVNLKK